MDILLEEENVISLRTAFIREHKGLVSLRLELSDRYSEAFKEAKRNFDHVGKDRAWLYRRLRSPSQEERLMHNWPGRLERDVKPMVFERPPQFRLRWADSGESVAVYLNEEPWAFIYEGTHQGYSKGVLDPSAGMWDQDLFMNIFGDFRR